MGIGAAALIVAVFFVIVLLTICLEAAFRNESEKNLNEGIKKGEESKIDFPPPALENPKSN
jgi:hypothetical protein